MQKRVAQILIETTNFFAPLETFYNYKFDLKEIFAKFQETQKIENYLLFKNKSRFLRKNYKICSGCV